MALNVTGTFELPTGQTLTSVYCRTNAQLIPQGNYVSAYPDFWVDEAAFTNKKDNLSLQLMADFVYPYDRETDGVDILMFSNQKAKETLESLGYTVEIVEVNG